MSFPELDFVRARLEPSSAPLPVLVPSRGVPTPNFLAVVSGHAIVHEENSPAELLSMLCTGGFWPGLCLRAMIGSARGLGTFPTMPVTYGLLSTPPYTVRIARVYCLYQSDCISQAATRLPSLLDLIVWPNGPAHFVQTYLHWPGVPGYRMTFRTSPLVRAIGCVLEQPFVTSADQGRCEVVVPRSIVHATEVVGDLFEI